MAKKVVRSHHAKPRIEVKAKPPVKAKTTVEPIIRPVSTLEP